MDNVRLSIWWWLKLVLNCMLVLYVLYLGIAGLVSPYSPRLITSQLFCLIGAGLNLYHYWLLKRYTGALQNPHKLLTHGGLFPYLRHPMYFGEAILVVGLVLVAGDLASAVVGAISLTTMRVLCISEDIAMAERFPEQFFTWAKHTGMLLPRFK